MRKPLMWMLFGVALLACASVLAYAHRKNAPEDPSRASRPLTRQEVKASRDETISIALSAAGLTCLSLALSNDDDRARSRKRGPWTTRTRYLATSRCVRLGQIDEGEEVWSWTLFAPASEGLIDGLPQVLARDLAFSSEAAAAAARAEAHSRGWVACAEDTEGSFYRKA